MTQATHLSKTELRELSDAEMQIVAGGRKAGESPREFLVITLENVLVTSVSSGGK